VRATFHDKHIGYVRQDDGGQDLKLLHTWIVSEGIAQAKIVRADFTSTNGKSMSTGRSFRYRYSLIKR